LSGVEASGTSVAPAGGCTAIACTDSAMRSLLVSVRRSFAHFL
jgi:hypothetical protein